MGLRNLQGLRRFCLELSTDEPSPGGGTAAAAAGAMGASLVVMVCGITARSKKEAMSKKELEALRRSMSRKRDELTILARQDAQAYDRVVIAMKRAKGREHKESPRTVQAALKHAAEVPMETATLCIDVLEGAVRAAELGKRSASSDVGVGAHLAYAGYKGAAMNVRINLAYIDDSAYDRSVERKLERLDGRAEGLIRSALKALRKGAK